MDELRKKIIRKILEDEEAMFIALEFIRQYQAASPEPQADPQAS